jgi:transposase
MIGLPANTSIWLGAGLIDMRCGFNSLAAKAETAGQAGPSSGHVFVIRGRRGDIIKLLWTGDGLCLLAKRLGRGRFICAHVVSFDFHSSKFNQAGYRHIGISSRTSCIFARKSCAFVEKSCDIVFKSFGFARLSFEIDWNRAISRTSAFCERGPPHPPGWRTLQFSLARSDAPAALLRCCFEFGTWQ